VTPEMVKLHYPCVTSDSTPGIPWIKLGKTKGEVLQNHGDLIADAVIDRLNVLASDDICDLDEFQMLDRFANDPIRLFIKQEPHSTAKLQEGRLRLISSMSLVDELVTRILFSPQVAIELTNWEFIPSKPGMGVSTDEQQASLNLQIDALRAQGPIKSLDMSMWDWSVPEWLIELDSFVFLYGEEEDSMWYKVLRGFQQSCVTRLFSTSDGRLIQVDVRGIQNTGSFITARRNSAMRVLLGFLAGSKDIIAMGDDSVEVVSDGYMKRYAELGFEPKSVHDHDDVTASFCSHTFNGTIAIPENIGKTFMRFLCQKFSPEFDAQFCNDLRHSPDLPRLYTAYVLAKEDLESEE